MQKRKFIQWSPHEPSNFVVGSTELRLYDVLVKKGRKTANNVKFFIEDTSVDEESYSRKDEKAISLLSVNYEVQQIKCLAWSPVIERNDPNVLAVGLPTGKILLTSLSNNRISKEFTPKHSRSCNAIAWNPKNTNQIAVALDKVRGDFSTLVWDITQSGIVDSLSEGITSHVAAATETITKPAAELANSEATTALAWVPASPQLLVTGTGVKWLRIYDLRGDINTPQSVVAHSRAVNGVSFDPFHSERLASFSEDGIVKLWDIRMFNEPTHVLNTQSKGLLQLDWCPTRSGILASISRDEKSIKFWDLKDNLFVTQQKDKAEGAALKPMRVHETFEPLSSFSFHPSNQYRILTVSNSGIVELISLQEAIPLSVSARGDLTFGHGKQVVEVQLDSVVNSSPVVDSKEIHNKENNTVDLHDISFEMKKRVSQGYGMDIGINKKIIDGSNHPDDRQLKIMWNWLHSWVSGTMNLPKEINAQTDSFMGLASILSSSQAPSKKVESYDKPLLFPVYVSLQRNACLQICGWFFEKKDALEQTLSKLEAESQFEKAAALALFHFDLKRAIASLNKGASLPNKKLDYNLKLVAMALAGTGEQVFSGGLWKDALVDPQSMNELKHPYLRACFTFLTCDSRNFKPVLDLDLTLHDKVAFACRFLDDNEITDYARRGNLEGVTLTGLDSRCVDILEQYVNITGDVQTASLVMSLVVPKKFRDARVDRWILCYRSLLDNWQLWQERAKFDMSRIDTIPAQVFVRCNFCNQPLARGMIAPRRNPSSSRMASNTTKQVTQQQKISSCPGCKKPLPRCALCLLPFNCTLPNLGGKSQSSGISSMNFDDWFTWCQNCRHGGHAAHMIDWFKNHTECPVSDCPCKCSSL